MVSIDNGQIEFEQIPLLKLRFRLTSMTEKILFLTGKLAERSLHRVLESMQPTDFDYEVRQVGASVAALMTPKLIQKRLELPPGIDRILLPGRVRGDLEALEAQSG